MKRRHRLRLDFVVPLAALIAFASLGRAEALQDSAKQTLKIPGLEKTVEILVDRWGVAHIYAETEHDLFFAQGYYAVMDRTFQFEIWRRQATGTVAEILGRRELDRDIGTRLHRFRKDMKQELNHYHPRGEKIVGAFVDGVNAYIALTEREPERLSIEFRLLGIKPEKWTTADVVSRHQGLLSNVLQELRYGQAVHSIGADSVQEIEWFRPLKPKLELDPAINGALLKDDILDIYRAFRRPITFKPEDIVDAHRDVTQAADLEWHLPSELDLDTGGEAIGSNNWVLSGRFTQTGLPYVVNDPHRVVAVPSLRYFVHLQGPGWNVIGGGEPVLPGISIGHNEFGAWGLTVFGQDNEDLYVYDINPNEPNQYRYRDGWESMRIIKDEIPIKGEPNESVELKYTRHGPVVYQDKENNKAYAVRAAWLEIGNSPYLASLRINQATSWEEFVEACAYSGIPAENMIWGDKRNNIGYQAVGVSPIRPNWSGLVPVPGDGRYEWAGYLPIKALPRVENPDKGYWATANNLMAPHDFPHPEALHWTWGDEMRGLRVDELMSSGRRNTVVDMMNYQHDELAVPARSLVPLLKPLQLTGDANKARQLLSKWDFIVDKDSVEAAIYVSFERELLDRLHKVIVPEKAKSILTRLNKKRAIDWLVAPDGRFGERPIAGRDNLLAESLNAGLDSLTKRLGSDWSRWQYGQAEFKHIEIRHALSPAVSAELRKQFDVGPLPRGGYDSTLNNTGRGDNQTSGASFRIISDVADWDNSIATSAPGQAGDPSSPHYRDLFELWAKHQYFPLFFTRPKVESVTEQRFELRP